MKILQLFFILASLFKSLNCEIVVDVKILDSDKNALSVEQIEHTRLLTVEFWRGGEAMYSFDLRQDIPVVSPVFEVYGPDKDGNSVRIEDVNLKKNCYFSGAVEGFQESMVAMSFCQGIMGSFMAGENSYQVNEVIVDSTPSFSQATLHKQEASNQTFECGVKTGPTKRKDKKIYKRETIVAMGDVKVIELFFFVNKDTVQYFGTVEKTVQYLNILLLLSNLYYMQANFYLIVTKWEIWTGVDKFDTRISLSLGSHILYELTSYKEQHFKHVDHDAAIMFLSELNDVKGLAHITTICHLWKNNAWVNLHKNPNNMAVASIFTHELGHILGLEHDMTCIPRPRVHNIMHKSPGTTNEFMYVWTECSLRELQKIYNLVTSFCLIPYRIISEGECGDGIVNNGEECDNFGVLDLAQKKCCDPRTCKLFAGAKCWRGRCCDVSTCQFKRAETVCRNKDGLCDEDDVCSGSSGDCRNRFKRNGVICAHQAVCFKGKCQSRDRACESLFGTLSSKSIDLCYTYEPDWAPDGIALVNCGLDLNGNYLACERRDRVCGTLMCYTWEMQCTRYIFEAHPNYIDISPRYAPEGSYCGENMFCINKKCILSKLYMDREFEKYGDAQYSYDDQEVDGNFDALRVRVKSGGEGPKDLSTLLCGFLMICLLLSFSGSVNYF